MKTVASTRPINVALIDLYRGEPNQGIRAITELTENFTEPSSNRSLSLKRFETRLTGEIPDLSFDIYLFSGGPGSPFDGEGKAWEKSYFNLIDQIWNHNEHHRNKKKPEAKYALFICHSFQMMCRHFNLGSVVQREEESFGIFRTHQTESGKNDILFSNLSDPFYAADFRKWQVINPDKAQFNAVGAEIIAMEKQRDEPDMERALMGIRISPEMAGVQFHPEADPSGMLLHFDQEKRRDFITQHYGEDSYQKLIERLKTPEFLAHTYQTIIPNFLTNSIQALDANR